MEPLSKLIIYVRQGGCVACGCCFRVCPRQTLDIWKGSYAVVYPDLCVKYGKCSRGCPASVTDITPRQIKTNLSSDNRKGEA